MKLPLVRGTPDHDASIGAEASVVERGWVVRAQRQFRAFGKFLTTRGRARWLLPPALILVIIGSLVAADAAPVPARAVGHAPKGHLASSRSASQNFQALFRPLPKGRSGTVGKVPFASAPPTARRHGRLLVPAGATDGIPAVAIGAYMRAQLVLGRLDPDCHLSWEDVAGIGHVESDNGQTWGSQARVTKNGTLFPPIYGIPLDGKDGTPAMRAPGGGWVRAEGPMQFLPSTWAEYARAVGTGRPNPQNFYDAAVTAGVFLCANGGNLNKKAELRAAIFAYNPSSAYVALVESWIAFYKHVGLGTLRSAGRGLLPVGTPSPRSAHAPGSPSAELAAAGIAAQSAGSYEFSLHGFIGRSEIATGNGAVNTREGRAWLQLRLPQGEVQMRLVGGDTYLFLPASLATSAERGTWILTTPPVLSALPAPLASGLALASKDLLWLAGQFEGASSAKVIGRRGAGSTASTEVAGYVNLDLAAEHLAGSSGDLAGVTSLIGSSRLGVRAWVSDNRLRSAVLSLGSLRVGDKPVNVSLAFSGFGQPVVVPVPQVGKVPPTTTTTTSTTSTSSTTSTTTTTTTTTTTSTTTTTTTVPPTTTATTVPPTTG